MAQLFRYFLLFFVVASVYVAHGQTFPSQIWHQGKVVLIDGDTVKGQVKYNLETDIVQVQAATKTYTFSPSQMLYFEIFDQLVNAYRSFYSLPFSANGGYKALTLFEVLLEGQVSLLSKEKIVQVAVPQYSPYYGTRTFSRTRLVYSFFFLTEKRELVRYDNRKQTLMALLTKRNKEVKQYMKRYNLRTDSRVDLIKITNYYNSLITGTAKADGIK